MHYIILQYIIIISYHIISYILKPNSETNRMTLYWWREYSSLVLLRSVNNINIWSLCGTRVWGWGVGGGEICILTMGLICLPHKTYVLNPLSVIFTKPHSDRRTVLISLQDVRCHLSFSRSLCAQIQQHSCHVCNSVSRHIQDTAHIG